MADVVYKTVFKFKRGKKDIWKKINPVLEEGEPGYELDTGLLKIGDGFTTWNNLKYFGGDYSVTTDGKSINISANGMELYGFNQASAGQMPTKGNSGTLVWKNPDIPMTEEEILKILV